MGTIHAVAIVGDERVKVAKGRPVLRVLARSATHMDSKHRTWARTPTASAPRPGQGVQDPEWCPIKSVSTGSDISYHPFGASGGLCTLGDRKSVV